MGITKLCPLLLKSIVVHCNSKDTRVFRSGINAFRDNELVISEFLPCRENECMMYDELTHTCLYCIKSNQGY